MSFREIDRNAILEDERVQRLKKIKLLDREDRENEPKLKEKQLLSFPNAIPISNTPTLAQIITEENQRGSQDEEIIFQRAEAKIASLSDPKIAEYILDRLEPREQFFVVNSFDGLVKTIKEKYNQKSIDKDVFIRLIKAETEKIEKDLKNTNTDVTQRGKDRLQRVEDEADELTAKLEAERQQQEDDTKAFNILVAKNQKDKDDEEAKKKQAQGSKQSSRQKTVLAVKVGAAESKVNKIQTDLQQVQQDTAQAIALATQAEAEAQADPTDQAKAKDAKDARRKANTLDSKEKAKSKELDKANKELTAAKQALQSRRSLTPQAPAPAPQPTPPVPQPAPTPTPPAPQPALSPAPQPALSPAPSSTPITPAMNAVLFNIGLIPLKDADLTIDRTVLNADVANMFDKSKTFVDEKIKQLSDIEVDSVFNTLNTQYPNAFSTMSPMMKTTKQLTLFYEKQAYELFVEFNKNPTEQTAKINPILFRSFLNEMDTKPLRKYLAVSSYEDLKLVKDIYKLNRKDLVESLVKAEFTGKVKGFGLKKQNRRRIVGRGASDEDTEPEVDVTRKEFNGKFIDLRKLKDNILTIKYVKTNAYVPTVKAQHISNDVKEVITDLINSKFDNRLFEKLAEGDRRLVKRVIKAFSLDVDLKDNTEEEYKRQFDVILGQFQAGNNSPLIKNKLKQYVIESMESGFLTRRESWNILFELSNA